MRKLLAIAAIAILQGCSTWGFQVGTPPGSAPAEKPAVVSRSTESQIVIAANAVEAAANLGIVLLKNDRISLKSAKSFSEILRTASDHLHDVEDRLGKCRAATGSTKDTRPDPCAPTVVDDIALAVSVASDVQKVLGNK